MDTNVPKVANGRHEAPHADLRCISTCVERIREIKERHILVLDDGWRILEEYMGQLRSEGQPGVGDDFLKWVLTNQRNPRRCELVTITEHPERGFEEFPDETLLDSFDPSDRKFVAVARAHPDRPTILNAVDTDWWEHRVALEKHDIRIEFLCPDRMKRTFKDVTS